MDFLGKKSTDEKTEDEVKKPKLSIKEVDFKSLLKNRMVLGGIAVGISAVLVFGGTAAMDALMNSTIQVVKVKSDVTKGSLISKDMLYVEEVGKLGQPEKVLTITDDAIGKYAGIDMLAGDVLSPARLSMKPPFEFPYLNLLNSGELAISVSVGTSASSISAKVRPGDIVTVFASPIALEDGKKKNFTAYAPKELQYVRVLAVTNEASEDITQGGSKDDTARNTDKNTAPTTVTFLAKNTEQAALLAGLNENSQIHLALAVRGNAVEEERLLKIQDEFFSGKDTHAAASADEEVPSTADTNSSAGENESSEVSTVG